MVTSINKQIRQSIKHWYIPLIIGIILVATAIGVFTSPVKSYLALTMLFSISFLISGLIETTFAIVNRESIDNWGWPLTLGIITTLVGVMLVLNPEISMITLPLYIGFMVMFRSIMAIGWSLDLKGYGVLDWGNLMVLGVLGTIFSFILIWNPLFAGLTIVMWTGISLLISGIFSIYLAFKFKKLNNATKESVEIK